MPFRRNRLSRRASLGPALAMFVLAIILGASSAQSGRAAATFDRGDYETGNFSQWNLGVQAVPGDATIVTSPARQGKYAARFQVNPGDNPLNCCAGSERAEALTNTGEAAGAESWWGWSTYFPSDFVATPNTSWNIFTQWHNSGSSGQANIMFKVNAGTSPETLFMSVIGGDPNSYSNRGFTLAPLERNKWYDFVLHVKWEPDSTGFVELWLNGQQVVSKTFMPTIYYGQDVYLKQGFYRAAYSQSTVLYEDGMRRGASYSDVAGGASSGSAPAPAPAPQPPSGPDAPLLSGFVTTTDSGCAACKVSSGGGSVQATIGGGVDSVDTAYAASSFGGSSGWSGRVFARDVLQLPTGQAINGNLSVFQMRDSSGALVYELYVDGSNKTIRVWSPPGGLGSSPINADTGVAVTDGAAHRIEVSARANDSLVVRVDGSDRVSLTGLSGASTGNQATLRAGVDHYDTSGTSDGVTVYHSSVGATTIDWLGTRSSSLAAPAPTPAPVASQSTTPASAAPTPAPAASQSTSSGAAAPAPKGASASGGASSSSVGSTPTGLAVDTVSTGSGLAPSAALRPHATSVHAANHVRLAFRGVTAMSHNRITVLARTQAKLRVAIAVRARSGRLLGAVHTKADKRGRVHASIGVRRWTGQSVVDVRVTAYTKHHGRLISHRLTLSPKQMRLLAGD